MTRRALHFYWRRAVKSLNTARVTYLQHDDYPAAASRSYYAIFYAARAALLLHDVVPKSHKGLQQLFGEHLVKAGFIEPEWSRVLGVAYQHRLDADYSEEELITSEVVEKLLDDAERFVYRIEKYLEANGVDLGE